MRTFIRFENYAIWEVAHSTYVSLLILINTTLYERLNVNIDKKRRAIRID